MLEKAYSVEREKVSYKLPGAAIVRNCVWFWNNDTILCSKCSPSTTARTKKTYITLFWTCLRQSNDGIWLAGTSGRKGSQKGITLIEFCHLYFACDSARIVPVYRCRSFCYSWCYTRSHKAMYKTTLIIRISHNMYFNMMMMTKLLSWLLSLR